MRGSQWEVFQWDWEVSQWDGAELKIDGAQALQKRITAYKKVGVPSQLNVVFPRSHYKIL